ncbi:GNAT family N-acetyltransferase [Pseudomonas sp. DTU_2021_1001937_2_SI_NGA_ILE_001]|uniref:GNAT family N-acetyltransferase n=1 Tax=Pseudomonas sp. DTU_2021_1001937_2_SI_NGA_ILE_001 TaxID=3077589 RepID=UPI0025F440E2|nr:GNAT family N-acetyltransferase [Pseudomonas sp. DTU_2021_1001937_2_SI_NGA_ILE_001]WNW11053.1 GNAT family N-acetyltransferase [Pseudomonas sp. DTU_2021_1001937_2_SI_NGA_ILE_001]
MLLYRPLEEKDFAAVCALPRTPDELFHMFPRASYPFTPAQLAESLEQRSDPTVIEMQGEVVGYANFVRCDFRGRCTLGNVIISADSRSKGVGRYLIGCMAEIAFDKHEARELTASCFNHNVTGLLFYSRIGLRPFAIEERRDKQGQAVALIHLRLERPES